MNDKSVLLRHVHLPYIIVGVSYIILSSVSIFLNQHSSGIGIWLPNAILATFILHDEKKRLSGYLLVGLVSAFVSNIFLVKPLWLVTAIAVTNTIEIVPLLLLIWLFYPQTKLIEKINLQPLRLLLPLLIAITLGCILSAIGGAAVRGIAQPDMRYFQAVERWFSVDFLGMLTILPFGISLTKQNIRTILEGEKLIELILLIVMAVLMEFVAFAFVPFPFIIMTLIFPILAFRLAFFGTSILAIFVITTFLGIERSSLFMVAIQNPSIINYTQTIMSLTLLSMFIGGLLADRYMLTLTELRTLSAELKYQATHDSLTQLMNRSELERQVKEILTRRDINQSHFFCYLDLDRFKIVNDSIGHIAGDELLKYVTSVIQSKIREIDILARLGGDEFAIILSNISERTAIKTIKNIISAIRSIKFNWGSKHYEIGVSVGMVHFSPEKETFESLMAKSDVACYTAKHKSGNTYALYEDATSEASIFHNEIQLISGITAAIENNQFELYVHEVRSLKKDNLFNGYYEILLRLIDGNKIIHPAQFISTAERYNLMVNVDRWVIRKVLIEYGSQIARIPEFSFTLNLSANSINSDHFIDFLVHILEETPIPRERIGFELTETAVIDNLNKAGEILKMIQAYGAFIALDDFGSGLSSFNYLKHCPVKLIKIDGSFIKMINKSAIDQSIVESINQLAHKLGVLTVAEYVETEDVLHTLHEIGVDFAQGYAISKEVPITDLL